jgi:hypothetical protein
MPMRLRAYGTAAKQSIPGGRSHNPINSQTVDVLKIANSLVSFWAKNPIRRT